VKKRAFTLVEIIVSVALLGLIAMFVSSTILQTKNNNTLFNEKLQEDGRFEIVSNRLYKDIYQSSTISVQTNKRYSILNIKSRSSVYGIPEPYIVWLVLKEDNTLVRMESARKISLPIKEESRKHIFIDVAIKECTNFSVNQSKDKNSTLVYLSRKNGDKSLFEIMKL